MNYFELGVLSPEAKRLLAPMFFPFDDDASLVFCPFSTCYFFSFFSSQVFHICKNIRNFVVYIYKNEAGVMLTWLNYRQVMILSTKQLTKI